MEEIVNKWNTIKSNLKLKHGSFHEEVPEQLMVVRYLTGNEKVLEIGGHFGRNSLIIASITNTLVTLECNKNVFKQLQENIDLNNVNFFIENSALSLRKIVQKEEGGVTIPYEQYSEKKFIDVDSITLTELKAKYPIQFDTLVLDCEAAFYYILVDMPEILNGINLIIMENDYLNISEKIYVDTVLKENGFYRDYVEAGGWQPCYDFFYEVWKRN